MGYGTRELDPSIGYDYFIYQWGTLYKTKDGQKGSIKKTDNFATAINQNAIANLLYGGHIKLGHGTFDLPATQPIDFGDKCVILEGMGGEIATPTTLIRCAWGFNDFLIKVGSATGVVMAPQIRNIAVDGRDWTTALGVVQFRNCWCGVIENPYFDDFFKTGATPETDNAIGVSMFGDAGLGCYYNWVINPYFRRCSTGVKFGTLANANHVMGGCINNVRDIAAYGILNDGGGTNSCYGTDLCDFRMPNARALYVRSGEAFKGFGVRWEYNYVNVQIDAGGGTGNNLFLGGSMSNLMAGGTKVIDNGNVPSKFRHIFGFATERLLANVTVGTASTTIAHGLDVTPNSIRLLPRADARVWRSAAPDATNIYLQASASVVCDIYVSRE